jgi:outer membrane protein TolC
MRPLGLLLVALATCGVALQARAADRSPADLAALLDELDRASPELLALRARAKAAATVAPQRSSLPDPSLSASYTNDGVTSLTLGDSEFANLTLGWEQEVPGRVARSRAAAAADAEIETLRAAAVTVQASLRARVIGSYAQLWRFDRTRVVLTESRALLETAVQAAQARYESGEGSQEGLIRAQSAVRRVDLELEELTLARRQAEIALGAAVGRAEDVEFGETGELPDVLGALDGDRLAEALHESSPDVLQAAAKEHSAEATLDDARAQVRPTYSWLAAYQFRGGLDPMVMGGFSVRLPVWKNRKQQSAIEGAELARVAADHERDEAVVRVRANLRGLTAEVRSIDARERLYREALVPQALAAYESAMAAFGTGRAEMVLVLDDLERWIRTRGEEITLQARRVETIASLEAASGTTLFAVSGPGRSQ